MLQLLFTILTLKQAEATVLINSGPDIYVNDLNEEFNFQADNDEMITGIQSYHISSHEDRVWTFFSGGATGVSCSRKSWTSWKNDWDGPLNFECGSNQVLAGIGSKHDNHREDRRWKFCCCDVSNNVRTVSARWTEYLNWWDGSIQFKCGVSEALSGLHSYHDNKHEDRRWKAKCVALADDDSVLLRSPYLSNWINTYDREFFYSTGGAQGLYAGLYSEHSNRREDRMFKVYRTSFYYGTDCAGKKDSGYVNDWDKSFDYQCGGDYAIYALKSYHSNSREDRRFKIYCCDISKNGVYGISRVYKTGNVNDYDGVMDFRCGYNEVLVGLSSRHKNRHEDREFQLYCGRVVRE